MARGARGRNLSSRSATASAACSPRGLARARLRAALKRAGAARRYEARATSSASTRARGHQRGGVASIASPRVVVAQLCRRCGKPHSARAAAAGVGPGAGARCGCVSLRARRLARRALAARLRRSRWPALGSARGKAGPSCSVGIGDGEARLRRLLARRWWRRGQVARLARLRRRRGGVGCLARLQWRRCWVRLLARLRRRRGLVDLRLSHRPAPQTRSAAAPTRREYDGGTRAPPSSREHGERSSGVGLSLLGEAASMAPAHWLE